MNFSVISPAISFVTFLLSEGSVRVEPVGWKARLLTSRSAPLTASSALLAGPACGLHFYELRGDCFRQATAEKQDKHSISSVKTSVKSQLCYWLMIYCWMSQQLWASVYPSVKWNNNPPQGCWKDWDSGWRMRAPISCKHHEMLLWLAGFWGIVYLIASFYFWSFTFPFRLVCFCYFLMH